MLFGVCAQCIRRSHTATYEFALPVILFCTYKFFSFYIEIVLAFMWLVSINVLLLQFYRCYSTN